MFGRHRKARVLFGLSDVLIAALAFEAAYQTFHQGLDPHETLPTGYRVDLVSVSGKAIRLYFFDYDTYAWGMECLGDVCNRDSRFMILDKEHMPKPRGSSI